MAGMNEYVTQGLKTRRLSLPIMNHNILGIHRVTLIIFLVFV